MENTIIAALVLGIFLIIILEVLRYFRTLKHSMVEFEELKRRVEVLEDKINKG